MRRGNIEMLDGELGFDLSQICDQILRASCKGQRHTGRIWTSEGFRFTEAILRDVKAVSSSHLVS